LGHGFRWRPLDLFCRKCAMSTRLFFWIVVARSGGGGRGSTSSVCRTRGACRLRVNPSGRSSCGACGATHLDAFGCCDGEITQLAQIGNSLELFEQCFRQPLAALRSQPARPGKIHLPAISTYPRSAQVRGNLGLEKPATVCPSAVRTRRNVTRLHERAHPGWQIFGGTGLFDFVCAGWTKVE